MIDTNIKEGWLSGLKRRIANPLGRKARAGSNPVPSARMLMLLQDLFTMRKYVIDTCIVATQTRLFHKNILETQKTVELVLK